MHIATAQIFSIYLRTIRVYQKKKEKVYWTNTLRYSVVMSKIGQRPWLSLKNTVFVIFIPDYKGHHILSSGLFVPRKNISVHVMRRSRLFPLNGTIIFLAQNFYQR